MRVKVVELNEEGIYKVVGNCMKTKTKKKMVEDLKDEASMQSYVDVLKRAVKYYEQERAKAVRKLKMYQQDSNIDGEVIIKKELEVKKWEKKRDKAQMHVEKAVKYIKELFEVDVK